MSEHHNFEYDPTSPHSPEDQANMDFLVQRAREIINREEIDEQEAPLKESERILDEETRKEAAAAENMFYVFFVDPESREEALPYFERTFGLDKEKLNKVAYILHHAIKEHYYKGRRSKVPDEYEITSMPGGSTQNQLLSIIAEDFGEEMTKEAAPLIESYIGAVQHFKNEGEEGGKEK